MESWPASRLSSPREIYHAGTSCVHVTESPIRFIHPKTWLALHGSMRHRPVVSLARRPTTLSRQSLATTNKHRREHFDGSLKQQAAIPSYMINVKMLLRRVYDMPWYFSHSGRDRVHKGDLEELLCTTSTSSGGDLDPQSLAPELLRYMRCSWSPVRWADCPD